MDRIKKLLRNRNTSAISTIISSIAEIIIVIQIFLLFIERFTLNAFESWTMIGAICLFIIILILRIILCLRILIKNKTNDHQSFDTTSILICVILVLISTLLTVSQYNMNCASRGTLSVEKFHEWVKKDNLNQTITEISIQNTVKDAIPGAKDLSLETDGSILGWRKDNTLYLAGNKGIQAPEDCSFLFFLSGASKDEQKRWSKLKQVKGAANFKTKNAKNMTGMFYYCTALESIDVSEWDTSQVEKMDSMFYGCSSLSNLNVSKWDTSSVINMGWMFCECESLTSLDVSGFNTGNVVNMYAMFAGCKQLGALNVSEWDTSNVGIVPEDKSDDKSFTGGMGFMFAKCSSLLTLGETDVKNWILSDNVNTYRMFIGTRWENDPPIHSPGTLSKEKLTEWASKETTRRNGIEKVVFVDNLDEAPADAMDFSEEKDRGVLGWFSDGTLYIAGSKRIIAPEDCSYLFSDKTSDNDNNENWGNLKLIENARILDTSNVENMKNMFYNCRSLKSIDVSRWDTHIVKNMDKMFFGCKSLQEIDVSSFLTANVETMNCMFYGCQNLTSLGKKNVCNWDTSSVIDMRRMFCDCESLTSLNISGFNTENVTSMICMFYNCKNLDFLDVSGWNTSLVSNMGWMFCGCESLTSLNVSNFNTRNVVNMYAMFADCNQLESLEVSGWDTSNVGVIPNDKSEDNDYRGGMSYMFKNCSSLTTLGETGVVNWKLSENVNSNNMFVGTKWETNPPINNVSSDLEN